MNLSFKVMDIKLIWRCSDITLLEPIRLKHSMNLTYHQIVPNIKLPSFVKKRSIDIQLNNKGFLKAIIMCFLWFYDWIEFVYLIDDSNPISSICKLTWLHNPNVSHWLWYSLSLFILFFLLLDISLSFFVISDESLILRILHSFFNMEFLEKGKRERERKRINVNSSWATVVNPLGNKREPSRIDCGRGKQRRRRRHLLLFGTVS